MARDKVNNGTAGRFNITTPYNLTKPAGACYIMPPSAQIVHIVIGMAGFVLLVPLAITSNNLSVRRLGPAWRKLHKLVYGAALLGGLHFVMLVKGFQIEPLLYLGAVVLLLAARMIPKRGRVAVWA